MRPPAWGRGARVRPRTGAEGLSPRAAPGSIPRCAGAGPPAPSDSSRSTSARWSEAIRSSVHAGGSWSTNSRSSAPARWCAAARRGLSAASTISWWSASCASATAPHDGRARRHSRGQPLGGPVDACGQRPAVTLQRHARALDLERDAQLREPAHVLGREALHACAPVRLDLDDALALKRAQRGAQRVARHVVLAAERLLPEWRSGLEVALEDAAPDRLGQRIDCRERLSAQAATRSGRDGCRSRRPGCAWKPRASPGSASCGCGPSRWRGRASRPPRRSASRRRASGGSRAGAR